VEGDVWEVSWEEEELEEEVEVEDCESLLPRPAPPV
jgi:hypothetical protein